MSSEWTGGGVTSSVRTQEPSLDRGHTQVAHLHDVGATQSMVTGKRDDNARDCWGCGSAFFFFFRQEAGVRPRPNARFCHHFGQFANLPCVVLPHGLSTTTARMRSPVTVINCSMPATSNFARPSPKCSPQGQPQADLTLAPQSLNPPPPPTPKFLPSREKWRRSHKGFRFT
jgi:hypothetical protein